MPLFEGGIITERAADLLPEGFRRTLPPRVRDSGRIFRAIDGLEEIFETKGSGGAPEMLRREMGVLYTFDLRATLREQLLDYDDVLVNAAAGAANTTASTTFSFPTMPDGFTPCARHRLISVLWSVNVAANIDAVRFDVRQFADPSAVTIGFAPGADLVVLPGLGGRAAFRSLELPFDGNNETEYSFFVRSNAGGAVTGTVQLVVQMFPAAL